LSRIAVIGLFLLTKGSEGAFDTASQRAGKSIEAVDFE
jgi:hypothetical protein